MAKKALPEHVKRAKRSYLKEAKMWEAVDMFSCEQTKPKNLQKGAHIIAQEHGIDSQWRTITNRYRGRKSNAEAHEAQQKLTPSEEQVLVTFLNESAECGFPQTFRNIKNYANLIHRGRLGDDCPPVGES